MDLVVYAIPLFVAAMLLEWGYGTVSGRQTYRLNDTVNSLSMGSIRTLSKLVFFDASIYLFAWLAQQLELIQWSRHWLVWVFAFVAYDFFYYWFHRISHERSLFWASHVAHHQSEEFNLSTALRQTGTGFICSWVFYVPLFLIGCPPEMFYTVAALNLIYQFWVHTEHIGKLGWLEYVFVTPSNHRVHHARNAVYLDRNYAGVFILWDRWFGTFREESDTEPCRFGISQPLRSWNPVWANAHVYVAMWQAATAARGWLGKLKVLLASPTQLKNLLVQGGHESADVTVADDKYDPPQAAPVKRYIAIQFLLILVLAGALSYPDLGLEYSVQILGFAYCLLAYVGLGWMLENRTIGFYSETLRLLVFFGIIGVAMISSVTLPGGWLLLASVYGALSLAWLMQLYRCPLPIQS